MKMPANLKQGEWIEITHANGAYDLATFNGVGRFQVYVIDSETLDVDMKWVSTIKYTKNLTTRTSRRQSEIKSIKRYKVGA